MGKLYWSAAKTNTSSFIKKLLAGKVPLWFVFWFVHTLPIVIIKAGAATSYNHSAGPVGVIHIPYFIFSAYLVLKTAKTKKRDLDGLGKNAFFETVAVVIVWVQIFSAIGKLLFL